MTGKLHQSRKRLTPPAPAVEPISHGDAKGLSILQAICRFSPDQVAVLKWQALPMGRDPARNRIDQVREYFAYQEYFCRELLSQLHAGTLVATGVWDAERKRRAVLPEMFTDAQMDLDEITIPGHVIRAVKIVRAPEPTSAPALIPALESETPLRKKRSGGHDFRANDQPLLQEMERLISSDMSHTPLHAARAVVSHALGSGTDESKVKRLARAYNKNSALKGRDSAQN